MLRSDQGADRCGTRGRVLPSQTGDGGGIHAGGIGCSFRCPLGDVRGELVEAERVRVDPLAIDEVLGDDDVHHREHHRDVGSGSRLDELVGGVGGDGSKRIDHDDSSSVLARCLDRRPEVPVGEAGVRAPQEDQSGVLEVERIEAER